MRLQPSPYSYLHLWKQIDCKVALILFWIASAMSYIYTEHYLIDYRNGQLSLVVEMVEGTAKSPYLYRVLMPFTLGAVVKVGHDLFSFDRVSTLWAAQQALFGVSLWVFLYSFYALLRDTFSQSQALIGALLAAITLPLTFTFHHFQPWSIPEAAFFMLGLLAIRYSQFRMLSLVVLIAALNRETAVFIPIAFMLVNIDLSDVLKGRQAFPRKVVLQGAVLLLIWLIVFAGLRLLRGSAPPVITIAAVQGRNMSTWQTAAIQILMLFGVSLLFAVLGYRLSSKFWQRLTLIIPIYLIPVLLYGIWREARLFMPILPLIIALSMGYLFPIQKKEGDMASSLFLTD